MLGVTIQPFTANLRFAKGVQGHRRPCSLGLCPKLMGIACGREGYRSVETHCMRLSAAAFWFA